MRCGWVAVPVLVAAACVGSDPEPVESETPIDGGPPIDGAPAVDGGPQGLCAARETLLACDDFDHAPPYAYTLSATFPASSSAIGGDQPPSPPNAVKLETGLEPTKPMGAVLTKAITIAVPSRIRLRAQLRRDCMPVDVKALDIARLIVSRGPGPALACAAVLNANGTSVALRKGTDFVSGSEPGKVALSAGRWSAVELELDVTSADVRCAWSVDGTNAAIEPSSQPVEGTSAELIVSLGPSVDTAPNAFDGACVVYADDVVVEKQ